MTEVGLLVLNRPVIPNFIVTLKQGRGEIKEKMYPSASVLVEATGRYSPEGVIVCVWKGAGHCYKPGH